ncbi:hypothetical protein Tco_0837684 [Tanacetum coccineum]
MQGIFVPLLPAMLAGAVVDPGNTSGSAEASMQLKELMDIVPKVKILEKSLKRKTQKVVISGLEGEEPEAAKTLSKVSSQGVSKVKSTDKGKRYRRRARSVAKIINTRLDAEEEINTGIKEVSTGSAKVDSGTTSKGQREGKAPIVEEDIQATHKTKEQIRQEEARLEEAIRLQAQMDEEVAKQIHLDKMLAKRVLEEQELSEQQLKRAEVQKAAQFYTEEYWDTIREKLEANTEVVKSLQGESISNDDFAKRMVEMINEKKKFYAEQKAKAKRNASITKGKDEVVKEEETKVPIKKTRMRWKQKARKGINIDKTIQDEFNKEREAYVKDKVKDSSSESEIGVDVIPTATKPPTIIGDKEVWSKYTRREYNRVLWGNLKTMFDPPLSDDAIWSLPLQQKIINWRYFSTCVVHCLTLDASTIYMLADRKYPLSKDACQMMLNEASRWDNG